MFGFEVEDVEIGDVLWRDFQNFEVDHRKDKGSLCVKDLTGLVRKPIFLHVDPVLQFLYGLQQTVSSSLNRHFRCFLEILRPKVLLIDLQQLHLIAKLRVNGSQHNRADLFKIIFMKISLELSVRHDAIIIRVLLQLRSRFHEFQL